MTGDRGEGGERRERRYDKRGERGAGGDMTRGEGGEKEGDHESLKKKVLMENKTLLQNKLEVNRRCVCVSVC